LLAPFFAVVCSGAAGTPWTISTFAGTGEKGLGKDGEVATAAIRSCSMRTMAGDSTAPPVPSMRRAARRTTTVDAVDVGAADCAAPFDGAPDKRAMTPATMPTTTCRNRVLARRISSASSACPHRAAHARACGRGCAGCTSGDTATANRRYRAWDHRSSNVRPGHHT